MHASRLARSSFFLPRRSEFLCLRAECVHHGLIALDAAKPSPSLPHFSTAPRASESRRSTARCHDMNRPLTHMCTLRFYPPRAPRTGAPPTVAGPKNELNAPQSEGGAGGDDGARPPVPLLDNNGPSGPSRTMIAVRSSCSARRRRPGGVASSVDTSSAFACASSASTRCTSLSATVAGSPASSATKLRVRDGRAGRGRETRDGCHGARPIASSQEAWRTLRARARALFRVVGGPLTESPLRSSARPTRRRTQGSQTSPTGWRRHQQTTRGQHRWTGRQRGEPRRQPAPGCASRGAR